MKKETSLGLYRKICEFTRNMKKENISAFASSAAFFIFLSLVPILIVICTIIPYTPLTEENLVTVITEVTPGIVDEVVVDMVDDVYQRSAGVLSVAVLVTLWSAGKGMMAVVRGLNEVNDVEEERNYFLVRAFASIYTLILLVIILISMILLVFGNQIIDMIIGWVPRLENFFSFLMNFRFLAVWLILTLIFSAFYAYVPNKKLRLRDQWPGACFAAVAWSIFSWCFSIYVEYGNSYSVYGSLAIVVIFLMWMYICIYIMFIGAYINKHMNLLEEEKSR